MRNRSLAQALSAGTDQANLMALARPVDAYKPFNLFRHAQALLSHPSHPGRRNERQSLYWRSKRNLPRDFRRGRPAGALVLSRCSKHRDSWATPSEQGAGDRVLHAELGLERRLRAGIVGVRQAAAVRHDLDLRPVVSADAFLLA